MACYTDDPPLILELNHGDLLVLATDGFSEWENAQLEQFGLARMKKIIRASKTKSPDSIIYALYRAVVEFSDGRKQMDDATAVVIKRI